MTVFEIKEHALDALSQMENERLASETDQATTLLSPFDPSKGAMQRIVNPMEMTAPVVNLLQNSNSFGMATLQTNNG